MYKLVTNDSSAYALSILPFEAMLEKKGVQKKVICIAFGTEIDTLKAVKEICTDELKTAVLSVYEDSTLVRELKDYTVLEQITTATIDVDGEEVEVLMAKLSQSTSIPDQILALEGDVKALTEANESLKSENSTMKQNISDLATAKEELANLNEELAEKIEAVETANKELAENNESLIEKIEAVETTNKELVESMTVVSGLQDGLTETNSEVATIKKQLAGVDENELDLNGLKDYRIQQSKINLATYLATHTVTSDAHKGVAAEYSMTADKQSQLMAVIMMCTLNPEYQPSWNASGEVCTYDWTLDELQVLAATIEATVRPLVSKQQTIEVEIKNAETIEAVKAIDITF